MKIIFLGDIMPGGILPYQKEYYDSDIKAYLDTFDFRVGTLESAIGDNLSFEEKKMEGRMNIIYSKNEDLVRLKELNINVVSLANNHIFDLGINGFKNTVKLLRENKILYCGAGLNLEEASRPVIIKKEGKEVAILSFCDYHEEAVAYVPVASNTSFGINPLKIDKVIHDIKKYKSQCDYVFILPHWGIEYSNFPMKASKQLAYAMIEAGADLIIGSHTHRVQPMVKYNGVSIYFSLGNFLFPDFYINVPRPIWYPDKSYDISSIETTYEYPFPVRKPLKRVWKSFSRIGMVVELQCDSAVRSESKFTVLSKDNIISLTKDFSLECKLKLIGILVRLPFYNGGKYIVKAIRCVRRIFK